MEPMHDPQRRLVLCGRLEWSWQSAAPRLRHLRMVSVDTPYRSYVRLQGFWAKQFSSGPCRSVRGDDIQLHGMGDGALRRRSIKLLYAGWLPHSVFRPGASPV